MQSSFRQLRIVHLALLLSIVLYGFVSRRAPAHPTPPPTFLRALALLSVAMVVVIFAVRSKLLADSAEVLVTQPEDKTALARWRTANIFTWVVCESIALYGLVLRFAGLPMRQAVYFFAGGFLLMAFFAPRKPGT